jgi:hypothetical protein
MSAMNPADFLVLMEKQLQPAGVPFSRAALQAFVEAAWPRISDDPDVAYFASEFLATGDVMAPESSTPSETTHVSAR